MCHLSRLLNLLFQMRICANDGTEQWTKDQQLSVRIRSGLPDNIYYEQISVYENVEVFDLQNGDGDAQFILRYREKESYDCVNSSHCLEHMKDVPAALSQWWKLVKPGGYMVIVVPHEDLYEQKIWPSVFNQNHTATFRLKSNTTWSSVSYDLFELMDDLPSSKIIESELQDLNYDYKLLGKRVGKFSRKFYKHLKSNNYIKKKFANYLYKNFWVKGYRVSGVPIDQTLGDALAQV